MNTTFQHSTIFNISNEISYADGGVVSKQVLKNDAGNITLFSFDKGQGLSEHAAPFDAVVHVIDGEVEVKLDKKPYILKSGDYIIMPANIPHALVAITKFKMLLTMIKGK